MPASAPPPKRSRTAAAHAPHEVRVIAGRWRGSKLPVGDAPGLRPTPNRLRETLFNWLGQDLTGWRVLDAFAGSGALGVEAASRGAHRVTLIERDRRQVQRLREVSARLQGAAEVLQVLEADAIAWMQSAAPQSVDLLLLDPPFDQAERLQAAAVTAALRLLPEGGWLYLECAEPCAPDADAGLHLHRQSRAGAVYGHLFRRL